MIIDKSEVRKEKNTFRNKLIGYFTQSDGDEQIDIIYFDGRKDQPPFQREDAED